MKLSKFIEKMEETYPVSMASDWDNSGLQIGESDKKIKNIFVTFEINEKSLQRIVKSKCDIVITHHPLMFNGVKNITDKSTMGRRILALVKNDIACYSLHTNYDKIRMTNVVIKKLGYKKKFIFDKEENFGGIIVLDKPMIAKEFAKYTKAKLDLKDMKVYGNLGRKISRIAILPGSGKSFVDLAIKRGCDAYLTGDIDHHTGLDAQDENIVIMDCGHYGLEHVFMKDMEEFIKKNFGKVNVSSDIIEYPYNII